MKRTKNIISILVLLFPAIIQSQTYSSTLGLRFGDGSGIRQIGITGQYRLAKKVSLEAFAQTDFGENHSFHILVEQHRALASRRLNYYIGAGPTFGVGESFVKDPQTKQKVYTYNNFLMGADVVFGLEFTMLKVNLSWDIKPNFNLVGRANWISFQTGFSVRSVLVTAGQARRRKNKKERIKRREEREKERAKRGPSGLAKQKWWPFKN